jgi:hypothetical protein
MHKKTRKLSRPPKANARQMTTDIILNGLGRRPENSVALMGVSSARRNIMANVERAMQIKGIGALICKLGLVFMVLGAFSIFLGALSAGLGANGNLSPGHLAILAGVAVALYLGLLPVIMGGILWLGGVVWKARVMRTTPNQSSEDQEKTIIL